jgi:hypothetical protein
MDYFVASAPRNDGCNQLIAQWKTCGKPADDGGEKLVDLPCKTRGPTR